MNSNLTNILAGESNESKAHQVSSLYPTLWTPALNLGGIIMTSEEIMDKSITKEDVKYSQFGCVNCLWQCVECNDQDKFEPTQTRSGEPSCKSYAYYD